MTFAAPTYMRHHMQPDARGMTTACAAALAFLVTGFAPQVLNDGDTFLHIAAGSRMLAEHAILFRDPFSYTFAGARWNAHEWLAEIVMALAYKGGGWSGLLLLFACAAGVSAGALAQALGRRMEWRAQAAVTLLAMACMTGSLLARPHLLALPLLAIWTAQLVDARAHGRAPSWWLLPIMCVWANIHGSFLLGFAIAGGLALEAVIADRGAWRGWALFGAGATCAALINPHFVDGVIFPFKLMATPALANVGEWQATGISLFQPIVPVSLAALYWIVTRRVRLSLVRAAMLVALLAMALMHARHQIVFAMVAPLLLADPLATGERRATAMRPALTMAAVILAALGAMRLALPVTRGDAAGVPMTALAHVPAKLRATPVLNDYSFGGYLIFAGVRPFIDSRAELYGEAALEHYADLIKPDAKTLTATLARYRIRWSILAPSSPMVAELDALPGWRRLYADRYAVVQIRDSAPDQKLSELLRRRP
jgi:hypothetical protein